MIPECHDGEPSSARRAIDTCREFVGGFHQALDLLGNAYLHPSELAEGPAAAAAQVYCEALAGHLAALAHAAAASPPAAKAGGDRPGRIGHAGHQGGPDPDLLPIVRLRGAPLVARDRALGIPIDRGKCGPECRATIRHILG